jgi:hypothetical protein
VLAVRAITNASGRTSSETYSVGVGAGADSDNTNDDRGVTINVDTLVQIGGGAQLDATSIDLDARVDRITGYARAKSTSYSPIFFGVATAFSDASVNVDSHVDVELLGASTRITADRGADVQARQSGITITRDAWQLAVALIPPQSSRALGVTNLESNVTAASGLLVTVGARDASRLATTALPVCKSPCSSRRLCRFRPDRSYTRARRARGRSEPVRATTPGTPT